MVIRISISRWRVLSASEWSRDVTISVLGVCMSSLQVVGLVYNDQTKVIT